MLLVFFVEKIFFQFVISHCYTPKSCYTPPSSYTLRPCPDRTRVDKSWAFVRAALQGMFGTFEKKSASVRTTSPGQIFKTSSNDCTELKFVVITLIQSKFVIAAPRKTTVLLSTPAIPRHMLGVFCGNMEIKSVVPRMHEGGPAPDICRCGCAGHFWGISKKFCMFGNFIKQ